MTANHSQRNGVSEPKTGHHNGSRSRVGASNGGPRRVRSGKESERNILQAVIRFGRDLPGRMNAQMKSHPTAALATVGGVSFAFGALVGSRFGRLALAAAIPFLVKRLFEGDLGREIGDYARGLADEAVAPAS